MTQPEGQAVKIVERIPFPWTVSIVVALAVPLSLYLGKFNVPLWVSFIVWAQYFAYGGKPSALRFILPSWPYGVVIAALWVASATVFSPFVGFFWALVITAFAWVTFLVYGLRWPGLRNGNLAAFNGFSMFLGVYFTNSIPEVGPMADPYWVISAACIWTILLGYLGAVFGWFNALITFPHKVIK